MTRPSLEDQRKAWRCPPVDDVGYIDSAQMLAMPDQELKALVRRMEDTRYLGWRNHEGRWRRALHLDDTRGARVLDYGCGVGLEALQYVRKGNEVTVADFVHGNVTLAMRVLWLLGYGVPGVTLAGDDSDADIFGQEFDVIHCAGVLHHIVEPRPVVERMYHWLRSSNHPLLRAGELRLMVYSDVGWRLYTGTEPPEDVTDHPAREQFVRAFDQVGDWADWYNEQRLNQRFGDLFHVAEVQYLTPNDRYLAAVLRKRGDAVEGAGNGG